MTRPLTILFVEDDPDIRTIVAMALALDGSIEPIGAHDARAALALLDDGLRPDGILVDEMMPDMTGSELFADLRERPDLARVPIIFLTAKARDRDLAAYRKLGATAMISKPFDPLKLATQVRELVGEDQNI